MAFKLSKEEKSQKDDFVKRLREKRAEIEALNEEDDSEDLVDDYNSIVQEAREFVEQVAGTLREAWDEKSENWQEGDRGVAIGENIDLWESMTLEDLDEDHDFGTTEEDIEGLPDNCADGM
jgi:hypothetical protein